MPVAIYERELRTPVPPSDEVLNYLWAQNLPVRLTVDEWNGPARVVYGDFGKYIIAPPKLEDPRVVHVLYDVHRNEIEQGLIGQSLEEDKLNGVMARQVNRFAPAGKRYRRHNMGLIFPGNANAPWHSEIRLAYETLKLAQLWNPDIMFELHNAPLADNAYIAMRRDVSRYVGRVAAWLSEEYEIPIVEAAPTTFSGNNNRSLLMEMPLGDPRFSVAAWRTFLPKLVGNKINLPSKPAVPHYSYYGEIPRDTWLATGEDTKPRPAFSRMPDHAAMKLRLPVGTVVMDWVGGRHPCPGVAAVPFDAKSNPHNHDIRRVLLASVGRLVLNEPYVPAI